MTPHRRVIQQCKVIARQMGIGCRFQKTDRTSSGWAHSDSVVVQWTQGNPAYYISSIFCHEVNHVVCRRSGKYLVYHQSFTFFDSPKDEIRWLKTFLRTALRAERYVDAQGEKMHHQLWPCRRFLPGYHTAEGVQWFRDTVLAPYRTQLALLEARKAK